MREALERGREVVREIFRVWGGGEGAGGGMD